MRMFRSKRSRLSAILLALMLMSAFCFSACSGTSADASPDASAGTSAEAGTEETASSDTAADASSGSDETDTALSGGKVYADIDIRDYGTVTVELDPTAAPKTVENFVKLAKDGFYDGLTFHRIMDGFMMQGGDPTGTGTGGSEETIVGEFAENGVDNPISHERGVISMARSQDPDSASSQFFITNADSTFLDGQYAGFGHVTEGMDVVDAVCADAKPTDNNGTIPAENQPVISSVTIREEAA